MGPRTWKMPGQRRGQHDELGKMVVRLRRRAPDHAPVRHHLLRTDPFGAVHGDAGRGGRARAGIVASSTAVATAETQAGGDISWMGKGACYEPDAVPPGPSNAAISCRA